MAFFEIEWAPQRPVAAPPACPRPPRGHGTSPRPSGMLGSSITPFIRAVLRRASRRAAQRSAQTTKQIRRRPWRHPLWRQPRKRHSLAGKDYGKARVVYPDFTLSTSGIQYKDLLSGSGEVTVTDGSRVVVDWSGYTIGYYGRIFEVRLV